MENIPPACGSQTNRLESGRAEALLARMARVPFSRWHLKARVIMGSATFFDAFDALSLAFVLPVLKGLWQLSAGQVSWLISVSYIGQLLGALLFGALAEKLGRIRSASLAVGVMSIMALACIFTGNFQALLLCRFLQGIGVGGEVPVAATYINELSPVKSRGRFFLLYELIFPIGLMATGQLGTYLVPSLGWKSMFLVGGIPGLIITFLVLLLPESPRWLIAKGRYDEAERLIGEMERNAGARWSPSEAGATKAADASMKKDPMARTDWREIFSAFYRRRTLVVWGLWFLTYLVTNGLNNWLPTLYRTVYNLDLKTSLRAASMTNVMQVLMILACALIVDRVGRKRWTMVCYLGAIGLFVGLGTTNISAVVKVGVLVTLAYGLLSSITVLLYLYTPEIYPTRNRAVGTGMATAWLRLGSSVGPAIVGTFVAGGNLALMFLIFAGVCAVALAFATGMIETRGRSLEEISP